MSRPSPVYGECRAGNHFGFIAGEETDSQDDGDKKWGNALNEVHMKGEPAADTDAPLQKEWKKALKEQQNMGDPTKARETDAEDEAYADLSKDEITRAKWKKLLKQRAAERKSAVKVKGAGAVKPAVKEESAASANSEDEPLEPRKESDSSDGFGGIVVIN